MSPLRRARVPARPLAAMAVLLVACVVPPQSPADATPRPALLTDSRSQTLQREVARAADRLAAATATWEQGQARLGAAVQQKFAIEEQLAGLDEHVASARLRMNSLAQHLYRNQGDQLLVAALRGDPRSISDLMYLRRRAGSEAGAVRADSRLVSGHQQLLRQLLSRQQELASAVTRMQVRLDDQLAALQAQAVQAQRRLEEHRRRLAEAAARRVRGTCQAEAPLDAANGFLPAAALCPLRTAPGHQLTSAAARAFDAMSDAFRGAFGKPLCVTDSYRTYAEQVDLFARKPSLAAVPGRSNHGWGRAVDLCGGVERAGSPPYQWLKANAGAYGWVHPAWAEPGGSRPEAWHWEYGG